MRARAVSNTSATSGYLRLTASPSRQEVEDVIQGMIVGITGLDGELVRPRNQPEPPMQPGNETDWAAYSIKRRGTHNFAQLEHCDGYSVLHAHEELAVLVSFMGQRAEDYATTLRDGLHVSQNREQLYRNYMALVEVGELTPVPEVISMGWRGRCDLPLTIRRGTKPGERQINIHNIAKAAPCLGGCLKG